MTERHLMQRILAVLTASSDWLSTRGVVWEVNGPLQTPHTEQAIATSLRALHRRKKIERREAPQRTNKEGPLYKYDWRVKNA